MPLTTPAELIQNFMLAGKVALVTGGGGVLGEAMARGLGLAGARVALSDILADRAEANAASLRKLGIEAVGLGMDALDPHSTREAAERAEQELGDITILLNAAGGNVQAATCTPNCDFFNLPLDALQRVVALNLFAGAILPCQIIGQRMVERRRPASILNISSMNALRPLTRVVGYSASKAAVSNFTQWLAVHFGMELNAPVRVNALAPGFFLTEQNRFLLTTDGTTLTPRGETILAHTPMKRFGAPDDLIGAAVWLVSDASAFVSGIVLPIDGGFSAFSGV